MGLGRGLRPLYPGNDSAPGEGGCTEGHTYTPSEPSFHKWESEGPERAGVWSGPHSSAQCPPRDDPTLGLPGLCPRLRGEGALLGPWTEGLAWVYPAAPAQAGPGLPATWAPGWLCVPGVHVCVLVYPCPCLAVRLWLPVTAVHSGVPVSLRPIRVSPVPLEPVHWSGGECLCAW